MGVHGRASGRPGDPDQRLRRRRQLTEWLKRLDEPHLLQTGADTNLGRVVSGPAGEGKA